MCGILWIDGCVCVVVDVGYVECEFVYVCFVGDLLVGVE